MDMNIVPNPKKIEIGKPGNIRLFLSPRIVIPVPKITAIAVAIIIPMLFV